MGSKREEERNEKIIRGLMKLPPNRRCINCNSLAPQYVCTNFWTFVCVTCSGIHREFTHRVKSVSMAKFTFQEVDALQKGGNQRARELYLVAWDPQKQRHPDNSNVEKIREFIKSVYVDKRYAVDKSSDRPPRDPQMARNHEDETRRASSYHSYSQSPPYDFQYEERRYGKNLPSLTRKPGSDRGFYEGKLSSFLSSSRSSDNVNDERFANEASYPRASDFSVSSGGDPFRSDVLSPRSQRDIGSPSSDTSNHFSNEISGRHSVMQNSEAKNGINVGRNKRSGSSGSFGSFDSTSFKSVNSTGLQEIASEQEQSFEATHEKSSSSSIPQSSTPPAFNGLDLFSEPYAPQNVNSTSTGISNSHLPQSVDLFQLSVASSNGKTSDAVMPDNGGWATFDMPVVAEKTSPVTVPSSDGNNLESFNPFSFDQNSSSQTNSASHETSESIPTLWHDGLQNIETTANNTQVWNAFDDSPGIQPIQNVLETSYQADKSLPFGVNEALNNNGNVRTGDQFETLFSSLSSPFDLAVHDFSMAPASAEVHPLTTDCKPTNPFDVPGDAGLESSSMTQFWDMSSLQEALPSNPAPTSYVGDVNQSWFSQNSVPSYVVPGGVTFDPPTGSLGFIVGQAPGAQIPNVPVPGPVASIGGNPFA